MEEVKAYIVMVIGAVFTLLAPIQNFMYAMVLLFGLNFLFGLLNDIVHKEKWSTRKALTFFLYCAIFFVTACSAFIIGHLMDEHDQAVAVVKILCFVAIYIFGTNIFRNLMGIVPEESTWHKLFSLCYYVLSIKFIERFPLIRKWQEEREKTERRNTILNRDDF